MPADRFLPYGRQLIEDDDVEAVVRALRGDYLTTGPLVSEFEAALAARVGAAHAVAMANGTAALHAAYAAAGVGPDDEVVVPAITFLATANAARFLGARVVFADVDPTTGLLTAETLAAKLGPKTKVVAPVHLAGACVPLDAIAEQASRVGASVIEDAAHALGARDGAGLIGDCRRSRMTMFSFHPVKHVTTGEGGAITTNDAELARKLRVFRSHGMVHELERFEYAPTTPWYYEQQELGYNYRITDVQCALGLSQLGKLDRFLARRRELAALYDRALSTISGVVPVTRGAATASSAYHLYAVLIDFPRFGRTRAQVMQALRERGIGTQVHYPPVPSQPYYRRLGDAPEHYPGALSYAECTLSLPLFPAMQGDDVARVVAELCAALGLAP
ncbi:MAG TPA: UDP-4-amino-4,6-dideoxy-N-acetyl-beta-L-altrosamine transaminase [Polyangiaceae bacterium]|jgi:UDP-4-amino-4,6-dideoxy-N-acetyl-beta-L-altrosamine transaminase|nr:UDP-4-amino-4,6-dideoxy-N-acetyl-beta-L-altrosamine transaminase [Polyangiaceae bacterium]